MKFADLYDNQRLLTRVRVAGNYFLRLRGLMGQTNITDGLLLRPCAQVHTYFMRVPIDVIYLDRSGRVLSVETAMKPGRVGWYIHGAACVLELPANSWSQFHCGNTIRIVESEGGSYDKATG